MDQASGNDRFVPTTDITAVQAASLIDNSCDMIGCDDPEKCVRPAARFCDARVWISRSGGAPNGDQTHDSAPCASGRCALVRRAPGNLGFHCLTWPLTARPHQIIDIYLGEPFRLRIDGGPLQTAPETVVVGPQGSRRIQLYVSGEIHIFNILLQPAGLNRMIGIDMTSLVNEGITARDVLGRWASQLSDAVRSAWDFNSRVSAAERWFGSMLEYSAPESGIDHTSRLLLATRGRVRIDALVERSGLSARHFQRRFTAQVGLSPKLYARTIRFDSALIAHRDAPEKPWTEIVHEAGYLIRRISFVSATPWSAAHQASSLTTGRTFFSRCMAEIYKRHRQRALFAWDLIEPECLRALLREGKAMPKKKQTTLRRLLACALATLVVVGSICGELLRRNNPSSPDESL